MKSADQKFLDHATELAMWSIRAQDASNEGERKQHLDRAYRVANKMARSMGYKHPDDEDEDDDEGEEQ
jgi:hypothetical protein